MLMTQPAEAPQAPYFRTATGTRLHLPECPHLVDGDAHAAAYDELAQYPICEWSLAQVAGHGREHVADLDEALRRLGVPVEGHDLIRQGLRFVDFDAVFLVHSHTYAALGREGRTVAGFGKTYYWVGTQRVDLPGYVFSARSGHTVADRARGDVCPQHFIETSLTGECDLCR